ncbi:hypothetical protein M8J75_011187 [Diaphorina citri]|nr:hypothetical protein M8J75_011187 [Diaphorina citri]
MGSMPAVVTILLVGLLVATQAALGAADAEAPVPSESECRPYIEKALKEKDHPAPPTEPQTDEATPDETASAEDEAATEGGGSNEDTESLTTETEEAKTDDLAGNADDSKESQEIEAEPSNQTETKPEEDRKDSIEQADQASVEDNKSAEEKDDNKSVEDEKDSAEVENKSVEDTTDDKKDSVEEAVKDDSASVENKGGEESVEDTKDDDAKSVEDVKSDEDQGGEEKDSAEVTDSKTGGEQDNKSAESVEDTKENPGKSEETKETDDSKEESAEKKDVNEQEVKKEASDTKADPPANSDSQTSAEVDSQNKTENDTSTEDESLPEEELTLDIEIPDNLRDKRHVHGILKLDEEFKEEEELLAKTIETTLKELKRLYDNAIKPLEITYKYRDLSNRHFADPEIFSKPLVLFMGPWSGGKSSIINYLLDNEYSQNSLRTGAEPSPAYFNILSWGESPTILDGTQLAADWTFSGLQKFGQGLLDRLRGLQLPHPLLEKINIVEIPGILEIRKQVERQFPFNDACQWFIDRADIIFLVYDPSKLDVGPETEAILDQLKGREYQTRIILNKADQVKPEELMRVQGTLIWNISPLMSSSEPPVMYSTSLWSNPYEVGAPIRLLQAQEHAFLRDLRNAIDKRVENKIASARRFAVRVRNHAKMVDCYLTTYYNHKTFFGNRKKVADDIIEHPQDYHIYAGLSTLTNISRYDLPDPEVYRDFFRLNPVFEFKKLSDTCTYFRGCPINRLDVAIAYDLPELVGKYKKSAETLLKAHKEAKEKAVPAS